MAGNQERSGGDDAVRPRVDASSARLTYVSPHIHVVLSEAKLPQSGGAGALHRDNKPPRGDFARRGGGRGAGRGRGRGRSMLPSGKVAFVGTLSEGSSYSGGASSTTAPRSTPTSNYSAAGGTGISVLDDEEMPGGNLPEAPVEEQWPPVVKSVMEPMGLPLVRQPEPSSTGAVFCDATGQLVLADDSLFFIQLPTTLPLANATRAAPKTGDDEPMESAEASGDGADEAKEKEGKQEEAAYLCVHKSGKTVLLLGDKQFEVATAQTPAFCEEVYAVNTTEKQLSMLGSVERHLVVTPDFDALLS
ncbi:hypothetical protein BBJ28_00024515 [Nothophytophthora sp. Chile5]|nr:hypothetical protein BBJ28_00024515 [Nothophytophthora sp. Chile5]